MLNYQQIYMLQLRKSSTEEIQDKLRFEQKAETDSF